VADGRQNCHRLGVHPHPQRLVGKDCLIQVDKIVKKIDGEIEVIKKLKNSLQEKVNQLSKQYGIIE
jgi:hypothetical protein